MGSDELVPNALSWGGNVDKFVLRVIFKLIRVEWIPSALPEENKRMVIKP